MTLYAVIGAQLVVAGVLFLLGPILHLLDFFGDMSLVQMLAVCGVLGVALSAQSPAVVMAMLSETGAEARLARSCSARSSLPTSSCC